MRLPRLIPLCRSRQLTVFLIAIHASAGLGLAIFPWPWYADGVATLLLGLSLYSSVRPSLVVALRLGVQGDLSCVLANGASLPAKIMPSTSVFSGLIQLHLRGQELPTYLTLVGDSVSNADDFRTLRVWLRGRALIVGNISDGEAG